MEFRCEWPVRPNVTHDPIADESGTGNGTEFQFALNSTIKTMISARYLAERVGFDYLIYPIVLKRQYFPISLNVPPTLPPKLLA